MSLASSIVSYINSNIRKRGVQYFSAGLVRLTACGAESAQAVVTGSDLYEVTLLRDGKVLQASCSCPFAERGEVCKHVWAVILAVDAKGGLQGNDGTLPQRLKTMQAAVGDGAEGRATPSANPSPGTVPWTPTWRHVMDEIATPRPLVPTPTVDSAQEILYLLDMPSTLRSREITLELMSRAKKRDGSWGKLQRLSLRREEIPRLPDAADRKLLSVLSGAILGSWSGWYPTLSNHFEVPAEAGSVLLPMLCATGRFRAERGARRRVEDVQEGKAAACEKLRSP